MKEEDQSYLQDKLQNENILRLMAMAIISVSNDKKSLAQKSSHAMTGSMARSLHSEGSNICCTARSLRSFVKKQH